MRTKGEVKGGGTEKTEKKRGIAISTCPLWVSIQAPDCVLLERTSEGGSTLSIAHQGDQAWKPVSCKSSVGLQPTGQTLTRTFTSI